MKTLFDDPAARALMEPRDLPDIQKFIGWLRDDVLDMHTMGDFYRLQRCSRTRMCWHPGKQDNAQHTELPEGTYRNFPWPGALDHDMRLADQLCNEFADLGMLVWHKSEKIVRPRDAMSDERSRRAQAWKHLVDYELDQTEVETMCALPLFLNCLAEFGRAVLFEGWERRWRLGRKLMSFEDLAGAVTRDSLADLEERGGQVNEVTAALAQQDAVTMLMVMVHDPDGAFDEELVPRLQAVDPQMPAPEALRVLKAFRRGKMKNVEYFAPVPVAQKPDRYALVPGVDLIYSPMIPTAALAKGRIPRTTWLPWLSEADLRVKVAQEGWDAAAVELVLKAGPGLSVDLAGITGLSDLPNWVMNGVDMGMALAGGQELQNAGLYQVAVMYQEGVNKAGLPAIYRTAMHGASPEKALVHECDPFMHGRAPFIFANFEDKRRLHSQSRGIPELVMTHQLGMKKLDDGITAQSELRALPPTVETIDSGGDELAPAARLRSKSRDLRSGAPQFMEVPDVSAGTIQGRQNLMDEVDAYFCRGVEADPDSKQGRRVALIGKFCAMFKQMIHLMCLNCQQNVDDFEIGFVSGEEVNWDVKTEDLVGELDVTVRCDPSAIDFELSMKRLDALPKVLALDRRGTADTDYAFRSAYAMVFPEWARFGTVDMGAASQAIRNDEKQLITQLVNGFTLEEADVARRTDGAEDRLEVLETWMQTPGVQEMLHARPPLFAQIEGRWQNLQFQKQQYQNNADTGRVGVDLQKVNGTEPRLPMAAEPAGAAA